MGSFGGVVGSCGGVRRGVLAGEDGKFWRGWAGKA